MKNYKRYLVTAALPYANGPVHIGHMAGVYIPADIYVRFQRARKKDIKFVCGSDEHGVPITIRAMKEGISPQQVVDKYHALIKDSFERMEISFDIYSRTSSPIHHLISLKNYTTKAFSRKKKPNSFLTKRPTCSLPTGISQVPAPFAAIPGLMGTSVKIADHHSAPIC
jgi:methionyl-tRNA synthetase